MKRTVTFDETHAHKRVRTTETEKFNRALHLLLEVRSELFGTTYSEDVAKVQSALDTTVHAVNHAMMSLHDNYPANTSSLIASPTAPQPPAADNYPANTSSLIALPVVPQPLPSITPHQYIKPNAHGVRHHGNTHDFELLSVTDNVESWRCLNCVKTLKPFSVRTRRQNFSHHRSRKGHCTHPQSKAMNIS